MSRLVNTKRAYDTIANLLDQEVRKRRGATKDLEECRRLLDTAFYLLGWGQFEYIVRRETSEVIEENSRTKAIDGHAWRQLNVRGMTVRQQLDILFYRNQKVRDSLDKDYTVRNGAAHDNQLPAEARDVSGWLRRLEDILEKVI